MQRSAIFILGDNQTTVNVRSWQLGVHHTRDEPVLDKSSPLVSRDKLTLDFENVSIGFKLLRSCLLWHNFSHATLELGEKPARPNDPDQSWTQITFESVRVTDVNIKSDHTTGKEYVGMSISFVAMKIFESIERRVISYRYDFDRQVMTH
jgi:hypothetical protein